MKVLLALFLIGVPISGALKFDEQPVSSGLIFKELSKARVTYDSFVIVYHANLTDFFNIKNVVNEALDALIRPCSSVERVPCELELAAIKRQLSFMEQDELEINLFATNRTRQKRAIEFIGSFFSWAFGLVDADQAREYDKNINELRTSQDKLFKIQAKGLLFLKENIIVNQESLTKLSNYTAARLEALKETHKMVSVQVREIQIDTLIKTIRVWVEEHRQIAKQILRHLEGAIYGKISQLIPPKQFFRDLMQIEHQLPENQKLPIHIHRDNPMTIFKYSTTRATLYNMRLLIEITIPRVDRELYVIYKIIPIPVMVNDFVKIIIPSMTHVLFDQQNAGFIPISEQEFTNAKDNNAGEKIITPFENMHHDYKDSCEMNLLLNPSQESFLQLCNIKTIPTTNYIIPLHEQDQYYMSIFNKMNAIEFCMGKTINKHSFVNPGILTLTDGCRVRTDKITIRPRIKTRIESGKEIPLITNMHNISINSFLANINDSQQHLDSKYLKAEELDSGGHL